MARKLCLSLIVSIVVSMSLPAIAMGARSATIGVALQASQASVNREKALDGTNIYSEDSLETGANGSMRVAFGDSQIYLSSSTGIVVDRSDDGFSVDLSRGTTVISATEARSFQVLVDGATIRPSGKQSTSAEITWISPEEFFLKSNHGDLEIAIGDERETVRSGLSYRVSILPNVSPAKNDPQPGATPGDPKLSSPKRINLSKIIFGLAVAGATYGIVRVLVSPSEL